MAPLPAPETGQYPPPIDPVGANTTRRQLTANPTARRASWGALDQVIYGVTNLALSISVAQSVSQAGFGAFGLLLIIYTVTIGMLEGLTSEVFTVVYSTASRAAQQEALAAATGCAIGIGVVLGVVAFGLSRIVHSPVTASLPAFAVVLPALYLQDLWRFAFFATGRPRAAVLNDCTWAAVQVAALVFIRVAGHPTVSRFVLAWGTGALAGALLGIAQSRVLPRPTRTWWWLHNHGGMAVRYAGEFLMLFGSAQLVLVLLAARAGLADLGRWRAGQVLFNPLHGLLSAVRLSVTSLAVAVRQDRPEQLRRFIFVLSAGLGLSAVASTIAALVVPDRLGNALLGESWAGARAVLLPLGVGATATALNLGALTGLRALGAARESFWARAATSFMVVVGGSVGVFWNGAVGATWGIAGGLAGGLVLISIITYKKTDGLRDEAMATPEPALN